MDEGKDGSGSDMTVCGEGRREYMCLYMSSSSLTTTHGFHSVLRTRISSVPPTEGCSLHFTLDFSPYILVDPYELALLDPHSFKFWGSSNLELPVKAVHSSQSVLLVNVSLLDLPDVHVNLPLHMRYATPEQGGLLEFHAVDIPWPLVFWACPRAGNQALETFVEIFHSYVSLQSSRKLNSRPP